MSQIENLIEDTLRVHLADFNLPLRLEVASSFSFGNSQPAQLVSDVIIRYAQQVKQHPDQISKSLGSKLSGISQIFRVSLESGYLNIFIEEFSPELFISFNSIPQTKIFFPLSATGRTDATFLRVLALATSQLIFSKKQAKLIAFAEQESTEYSQVTEALLRTNPILIDRDIQKYFVELFNTSASVSDVYSTLWLSPEQLSKSEISKLYQATLSSNNILQIQIPHASWLKDLDLEIPLRYREANSKKDLLKISMLLSTAEPSAELYYDEAIMPGRNNLLWYLHSTAERLGKLGIEPRAWGLRFETKIVPPPLQDLVWSQLLLPAEQQKAIIKGVIPAFVAKVYYFLDRLNYFFNSPQLRQKIIKNDCTPLELEILASGLSLIQEKILEIESCS